MALTPFPHFSRLPKELRDMIWDETIRPDLPSAHFFTAWHHGDSTEGLPFIANYAVAGRGAYSDKPCGLAAPRCNRAEPDLPSWFDNNPSVYMEDSGLWTTCKESRQRMIRRFGKQRVAYQTGPLDSVGPPGSATSSDDGINEAPATGTMVEKGKRQYFTVCPKTDLFCLQPFFGPDKVMCWRDFEQNVPVFNKHGSPKPHIALEFDPDWINQVAVDDDTSYYDASEAFATEALHNWARNLWFIDYRIRRNLKAGPWDASFFNSNIRFQGRGCQYIEVDMFRLESWRWTFTDNTPRTSIWVFLVMLRKAIRNSYADDPTMFLNGGIVNYIFPRVGVLACIPDDECLEQPPLTSDPDVSEQGEKEGTRS